MRCLFDFGISQEDPLTEFRILDIRNTDHLLCVASGGEIPLSLLCLQPGLKITAVDISPSQLSLCRLKMQAAIALPFPSNGQFLGYAPANPKERRKIYFEKIHPSLTKTDQEFWMDHLDAIEKGVINSGRFEGYIKRLRPFLTFIIGKYNLLRLLSCSDKAEQEYVFDKFIGKRKAIHYLFRIAFHPLVYKKRGLSSQGLQHAHANTGELFFNKFRDWCIATPANKNYFLQYFLAGDCPSDEAFPEYCQEKYKPVLKANQDNLSLIHATLQDVLAAKPPGTFSKIHLSNIGDWMSQEDFTDFVDILYKTCPATTRIGYRFLQKNHFEKGNLDASRFDIVPVAINAIDRFPFYSFLSIHAHAGL